ncbi:hypothetical protein [Rubrivirga sp.]|uniref:hypothetical protein n=1 Tax=Rubrivirga sp. TaxID=1885344 RepID=UPI003C7255E2
MRSAAVHVLLHLPLPRVAYDDEAYEYSTGVVEGVPNARYALRIEDAEVLVVQDTPSPGLACDAHATDAIEDDLTSEVEWEPHQVLRVTLNEAALAEPTDETAWLLGVGSVVEGAFGPS